MNMARDVKELKIFLASPSDVEKERLIAREVIESASESVVDTKGISLRSIGWEDVPPNLGDPQKLINDYSETADLVVVIFWRRFGSPTAQFESGTLEEFTLAKVRWEKNGIPHVKLYFRHVDKQSVSDPGPELSKVLEFRKRFENDRTGLYNTYKNPSEFRKKFTQHLFHWIEQTQNQTIKIQSSVSTPLRTLKSYLQNLVDQFERTSWTDRYIRLRARSEKSQSIDLSDYLLRWSISNEGQSLFLIGEFGSGKTWALKKLARDLAGRYLNSLQDAPVPILVPLAKAFGQNPSGDIKQALGEWHTILEDADKSLPRLFLLDGLDEVIFISKSPVVKILQGLYSSLPEGSRCIVTCRSQAFKQNPKLADIRLSTSRHDSEDRTESALRSVLWKPIVLAINELQTTDADEYLLAGPTSTIWENVRAERSYQDLTVQPVMLYLLEYALPELSKERKAHSINDLYRVAIETWILRDSQCVTADDAPRCFVEFLRDLSALIFREGRADFKDVERIADPNVASEYLQILINAELLQQDREGFISFAHESFWEYFFAKALAEQTRNFDATLLSMANLIYTYPVNRFLIAQLNPSSFGQAFASKELLAQVRKLCIENNGNYIMSRPVLTRDYQLFIRESGWRRNTGYGWWTVERALDGTLPVRGCNADVLRIDRFSHKWIEPDLERIDQPVTGISWYDAYQFCRWVGGRLPHEEELAKLPRVKVVPNILEWTQSWFNESDALISTVDLGSPPALAGRTGTNPDFRGTNLGFRVVFENNSLHA
jgi:hypothetical protein